MTVRLLARGRARLWLIAALAGLGAVLTAMLAVTTNLATNAVPSSWQRWTANPWLMWGTTAVLALTVAIAAVLLHRLSAGTDAPAPNQEASDEALMPRILLHLRDGRPPLVNQVDPLKLGVKRAIDTRLDDGGDLPPYVSRDADSDLEWAIAGGGLVVLHGRAAAGKTRTAWEAARRLRPQSNLVVPAHADALRQLLDSGYAVADAVIWLDDLERFLAPGGLDEAIVQRLCPEGRQDVTILATIRDEELAQLRQTAFVQRVSGDGPTRSLDLAAARLVVQLPERRVISVGQYLSPTERSVAERLGDDCRLSAALAASEDAENGAGFAEYLAAGPAMMTRWAVGDGALFDVGQALVSAAVDCRRAGCSDPVPAKILVEIYRIYLSPIRRSRSDLPSVDDGFRWACQQVLGASSCLVPHAGNRYQASDYLLDRTQSGQGPLAGAIVPDSVWRALLTLDDPDEVESVAVHADWADRSDIAEVAYRIASDANSAGGVINLGSFLEGQGRILEAEEHWRDAANRGWYDAMAALARLLDDRGDLTKAKEWYRRAAEGDDPHSMNRLGELLEAEGESRRAEKWYRRAVKVEDVIFVKSTKAMRNLGRLLEGRGRKSEARKWISRAAEHEARYEDEQPFSNQ